MARTPWRRRATWHCHSWIGEDRGHWTQSAPVKEKSVTFSPMPLHDCRFNHHQNRIDSCIKSSKWNQVDQMVVERESERSSNKIKLRLPGALCWRGGEEQRMAVYHTVCGQTSATQLKTRLTTQIPNFPVLFWDSTQLKTSLTTQIPNFPVLFWDSTHLKTSLTTQIPNFPVLFWDSTQPKTSLTTQFQFFQFCFEIQYFQFWQRIWMMNGWQFNNDSGLNHSGLQWGGWPCISKRLSARPTLGQHLTLIEFSNQCQWHQPFFNLSMAVLTNQEGIALERRNRAPWFN